MSLVAAYGSSDESGESDTELAQNSDVPSISRPETAPSSKVSGPVIEHDAQISDTDSDSENAEGQKEEIKSVDFLLKGLPAPHSTLSSVITEDDELEDVVKPKPSQVTDLPKPPPKRNKQPVKITIPVLSQDSDEDEPTKKKQKTQISRGKSGLTSLLPPPVHAAKKEMNRILIPYSLGKKAKPTPKPTFDNDKQSAPSTYSQKKYSMFHGLTGYDSDSDENETESGKIGEPVSFFSLDSLSKSDKEKVTLSGMTSDLGAVGRLQENKADTGIPTVALPPESSSESDVKSKVLSKQSLNKDVQNMTVKYDEGPSSFSQLDPDAPLTFKGGVKSKPVMISSTPLISDYEPVAGNSNSDLTETDVVHDQNMYYNIPYDESAGYIEATDIKALEQDEEFLKLQGKPKRGKEEINIMDVNTADFISTVEVTKALSEEQQEHRSHKKKDMPSSQQRRKHQISYLAFQAKERELELKNQWASNRMTKKQTQAKYGF